MKTITTPYSLRLPPEMRAELTCWAEAEHRNLHSLILYLLDGALARRQAAQESGSAVSGIAQSPTLPARAAWLAEGAR